MRDELQDMRNWGALVFPALHEAVEVIATIEGEFQSEQDDLNRLVAKLKDLSRHYVVMSRSEYRSTDVRKAVLQEAYDEISKMEGCTVTLFDAQTVIRKLMGGEDEQR